MTTLDMSHLFYLVALAAFLVLVQNIIEVKGFPDQHTIVPPTVSTILDQNTAVTKVHAISTIPTDQDTVMPPTLSTDSSRLVCYTCQYRTDVYGQFCNKTQMECGEDELNCITYHYSNKNNTGFSVKGCAKDKECKNTTKTCEDLKKHQHFLTCNMSCCQTPRCNRRSTRSHIPISEVVLALQLSTMYMFP